MNCLRKANACLLLRDLDDHYEDIRLDEGPNLSCVTLFLLRHFLQCEVS